MPRYTESKNYFGAVVTFASTITAGTATSSNSVDPAIHLVRNVTGTSGNGHGFADNSQVNRSGTIGYNSFDAYIDLLGVTYDHVSGFQARPNINISGTVSTIYGLLTAPVIAAGTATTSYGVYLQNPSGAGTLGTDYGIYIGTQTKASTNYPIYSDSANAAIFKGPLQVSYTVSGGSVGLQTLNPSTGTTAYSQLAVGENISSRYVSLSYMNNSFTTSGLLLANRAVLQSSTGATNGLLLNTAAVAPVIIATNSIARVSVPAAGVVGFSPQDATGTPVEPTAALQLFAYNKSTVDDGIVTLPTITSNAIGLISTNGGATYALFTVGATGTVTSISVSADVALNADTDTKLCLGTAGAQEPLQIKNRLGATHVLNIVVWYD